VASIANIALVVVSYFLLIPSVWAHSGRTNSSGCHNCNVGSCAGTYHCHNGGTSYTSKSIYTAPVTPTCGVNAYYSAPNSSCMCKIGYVVSTDKYNCVILPANAHSVISSTDAWLCDTGYKEIDGKCIEDIVILPKNEQKTNLVPTNNVTQPQVNSNNSETSGTADLLGLVGMGVVGLVAYIVQKRKKV